LENNSPARLGEVMKRKILDKELPSLYFVVCPDADDFHGHLYLRYIIYGFGEIMDDPDMDDYREVRMKYAHLPIEVILSICPLCRLRGVTGITHMGYFMEFLPPKEIEPPPEKEEEGYDDGYPKGGYLG